jgi:teichuronic acid biosynthesis glycosyltransferase TuaC
MLADSMSSSRPDIVVVTTSYPQSRDDGEGHFVAAEVRRLREGAGSSVTVLAPGSNRAALYGERVISLGGGAAFGVPGAMERLRQRPGRVLPATEFVVRAVRWLRRAPEPQRLIAHFLLPCGVPIATRGLGGRRTQLEIVVHGSDARLFARSPVGRGMVARELLRTGAALRFVSTELRELVLASVPERQRARLSQRSRVEPAAIDVQDVPERLAARQLLGIAADSQVAVIVARLVPGKRVDVALEACARLEQLRTYVIGDGPELMRLMMQFPRAHFVGHVERPLALAYISAANVLVSASLREGAPTVVREARALGTQVVCLEAGDVRKWALTDPGLSVV